MTYLPIINAASPLNGASVGTITLNVNFVDQIPTATNVITVTSVNFDGTYAIITGTGTDVEDGTSLKNLMIGTLPIYGDLYDVVNGVVQTTTALSAGASTTGMQVAYRLKSNFYSILVFFFY